MIDADVWNEQETFNRLLRKEIAATDEPAIASFLLDLTANLHSEADELLRTTTWKTHRRARNHRPNREHRLEELVDLFKIWLTMVQTLGYGSREVLDAFWRKSMVVRQRHSEEFVQTLDRPAVVVDIDNVLCDYTSGFCTWIINRAPLFAPAAQRIMANREWFGRCSDFGMTEGEWQGFKHEFRSNGHKRYLPVMPGATDFLTSLFRAGYYIILLTSRPIDRYPNIYTDTLFWLHQNHLPYHWVWWAADKKEALVDRQAVKWVKFAVDDDPRYIEQFRHLGIRSYWLQTTRYSAAVDRALTASPTSNVFPVSQLSEIPIPPVTHTEREHGV